MAESKTSKQPSRWRARKSGIHGRGVFCLRVIKAGELIGAYEGRKLSGEEFEKLCASEDGHTFYFGLSCGGAIDGGDGGNGTRFINHGCDPNVEACEIDGNVFLSAKRDIAPGEELLLDYLLEVDSENPFETHPCRCGSAACRGTLAADPPVGD